MLREERRMSVFENRMLRRIFGPKRDAITGELIKRLTQHCAAIKSRRMRRMVHVARMGRGEECTGFWCGNREEEMHWVESGVDGRIVLRWNYVVHTRGNDKK